MKLTIQEAYDAACHDLQDAETQAVIDEAAKALADVRTLDEHAADRRSGLPFELRPNTEVPLRPGREWHIFKPYQAIQFFDATPDEARAKAAAWVREQKP